MRTALAAALVACLALAACDDGGTSAPAAPLATIGAPAPAATGPATTAAAPVVATPAPTSAPAAPPAPPPPATEPPATQPTATEAPTTVPVDTTVITDGAPPAIDAVAYTVYDATNQRWLGGHDADSPRPVGSVMKLLTTYVVMQAGDPTHVVTVPDMQTDPDESVIGLYAGEQKQRDLLVRAMLIVSANDAARALAIDLAGSEEAFAVQMNQAAASLGLTGTAAANPVGLDAPGAHSTARDMTVLAAVLLQDQTFRETVVRTDATLHDQKFPATNDLLTSYPGAIGVKTGRTTEAGYCIVGAAERDGRTVIVTVLGAPSDGARLQGATELLDWAFAQP